MNNTKFKKAAREHQVEYKKQKINNKCNKYDTWLIDEDAKKGKNFFDGFGIFDAAQKYRKIHFSFPLSRGRINLYSDMLRSEHIPFNLFIPLRQDPEFCKKVFNKIFSNEFIDKIEKIIIEYAPKITEEKKYLNDRTSFDTYIEYTHIDKSKGIICIEVKYTEKEYKLEKGSKQEKDINDEKGKYYYVTEKCGIYNPNVIDKLKTDLFRQIWRNHLLAESILIEDSDKFKHAHSLIFYPKDNSHFTEVGKEYSEMLVNNQNNKFTLVTFEDFIEKCRKYCPNNEFKNWIDYLQERYIIQ